MNKLTTDERARVISCLVEGCSIRSTVQMTNVHRTTIPGLMVRLGEACSRYCDKAMVNLPCKRIQCDEIWLFVGCKAKNATPEKKKRAAVIRGCELPFVPKPSWCPAGWWGRVTRKSLQLHARSGEAACNSPRMA